MAVHIRQLTRWEVFFNDLLKRIVGNVFTFYVDDDINNEVLTPSYMLYGRYINEKYGSREWYDICVLRMDTPRLVERFSWFAKINILETSHVHKYIKRLKKIDGLNRLLFYFFYVAYILADIVFVILRISTNGWMIEVMTWAETKHTRVKIRWSIFFRFYF